MWRERECSEALMAKIHKSSHEERSSDNESSAPPAERRKLADHTALPVHTHWLVSRSRNPLFIGRSDTLQNPESVVMESMRSSHEQCRIVITGMGGQGKIEICLQLAHRLRQSFWGVFWIDVNTTAITEQSFVDLASRLSLPAQDWEDARLRIANLKAPWLLVLDNADNTEIDYLQYFPDGSQGVVLLTSRNQECHMYATGNTIALKGLAENESRVLLLNAARVPEIQCGAFETDATAVAKLLQSHPLALAQAGAYISRGHCTLAQYPDVYERERKRLLKFHPTQARSRYGDVYATFEASAELLKTSSVEVAQDAMELLPLLAICGPNCPPLRVFKEGWKGTQRVPQDMDDDAQDGDERLMTPWHVAHLLSLLQSRAFDSFRLIEAMNLLKSLALVTIEDSNGEMYASMRPLIHGLARDRQIEYVRHKSWLGMRCAIPFSFHQTVCGAQYER